MLSDNLTFRSCQIRRNQQLDLDLASVRFLSIRVFRWRCVRGGSLIGQRERERERERRREEEIEKKNGEENFILFVSFHLGFSVGYASVAVLFSYRYIDLFSVIRW
jgi:hypothetical protein